MGRRKTIDIDPPGRAMQDAEQALEAMRGKRGKRRLRALAWHLWCAIGNAEQAGYERGQISMANYEGPNNARLATEDTHVS